MGAQDTCFEALKTRISHVSLEHVAAMEKVRLLEENNTRLQDEMGKMLEERGSRERKLKLELEHEKSTVKELKAKLLDNTERLKAARVTGSETMGRLGEKKLKLKDRKSKPNLFAS